MLVLVLVIGMRMVVVVGHAVEMRVRMAVLVLMRMAVLVLMRMAVLARALDIAGSFQRRFRIATLGFHSVEPTQKCSKHLGSLTAGVDTEGNFQNAGALVVWSFTASFPQRIYVVYIVYIYVKLNLFTIWARSNS